MVVHKLLTSKIRNWHSFTQNRYPLIDSKDHGPVENHHLNHPNFIGYPHQSSMKQQLAVFTPVAPKSIGLTMEQQK